jgi:uncharacterized protein YhaN
MGALRLKARSSEHVYDWEYVLFPTIAITTRQFGYLRKTGVIEATSVISEKEIEDKSQTDYFTKGLAMVQISWLVLSLIGRAARNLAISQLEILTVAFAACAIATFCFAWNKPQSVNVVTTVIIQSVIDEEAARMMRELQPKQLAYCLKASQTFSCSVLC